MTTTTHSRKHWTDKGGHVTAALGLQPTEGGVEAIEGLIRQPPHLPQGMGGGNPVFCGDVCEQGTGAFLLAAHPPSAVGPFSRSSLAFSAAS